MGSCENLGVRTLNSKKKAKKQGPSPRYYPEIDIIRGLAVGAMIIFHAAFQLHFIFHQPIVTGDWLWRGVPIVLGGTFLMVTGVSLYISVQRDKYNKTSQLLTRSGRIGGLGMCLTLITCMAHDYIGGYVYFGILHCIGVATLVSYYTLSWPLYANLVTGIIMILVSMYNTTIGLPPCKYPFLLWLYPCHASNLGDQLDYYPLIPWIGFVWMGISLGKTLYTRGQRAFNCNVSPRFLIYTAPFRFLGRHSLIIYCIHNPIIFVIIYLIHYFTS
jgi:uncharacterized membrane protein